MSTAMALHNHGARIDGAKREFIPLHRGSIEADESCAEEGGRCPRDEAQGRGHDCPIHPRPEPSLGYVYGWLLWVVGVVALIAGAAALMP